MGAGVGTGADLGVGLWSEILTHLRGWAVLNALWHLHGVFATAQQ